MKKKELALFIGGLLAGGSSALLITSENVPGATPAVGEQPYGSHELTDTEAAKFAASLLNKAKPSGLTCSKVPDGPTATLCTDGAVQLWISDEGAKAIGVPYGTIAISAGPDGKVYVR